MKSFYTLAILLSLSVPVWAGGDMTTFVTPAFNALGAPTAIGDLIWSEEAPEKMAWGAAIMFCRNLSGPVVNGQYTRPYVHLPWIGQFNKTPWLQEGDYWTATPPASPEDNENAISTREKAPMSALKSVRCVTGQTISSSRGA